MPDLTKIIAAAALAALTAAPSMAQDDAAEAPSEQTQTEPAPDTADENATADTAEEDAAADTADENAAAGAADEDAAADAPAPDASDPLGLAMGEEEDTGDVGETYVAREFNAWEMRCVRTESGQDPCQLYQLLQDQQGNNVAEISVFALPPGQQAAAGATIITPLETLLTAQVALSIDGGTAKRYPFGWCSNVGCFSRIGFTEQDIQSFKRGSEATRTIRPVAAPDQTVDLTVSLMGFTAGYDTVAESNAGISSQ